MTKLAVLLIFVAIAGIGFAFLYQPRGSQSRFQRIGQRVRVVAYAYVAAIVISAVLRTVFGWGT